MFMTAWNGIARSAPGHLQRVAKVGGYAMNLGGREGTGVTRRTYLRRRGLSRLILRLPFLATTEI